MLTAVFGLIGTLIGALVTWWGQRSVARRQERQRFQDLQRVAATEFLSAADLFIAEADSLRYSISIGMPEDQIQAVYGRYYERWSAFYRCLAGVSLSSIQPIRHAAQPVVDVLHELTQRADALFESREMPRGANSWKSQHQAAWAARTSFANAVRTELGVTDVERTAPRLLRGALRTESGPSET